MKRLSARERETIVRFSDDLKEPVTMFTNRRAHVRRLLTAGAKLIHRDAFGYRLEMDRRWFRWPRPPRAASEAQLAAVKQARDARAARKQ